MSALGQKRTFALHPLMSALPPKATSNATSAKGQKRTSGPYSNSLSARTTSPVQFIERASMTKWITRSIHTPGS